MNIVKQFPVNLTLNLANPATEQARKDSQMRELISQATAGEQSANEKGLNSDSEKSSVRQPPLTYDYIKSQQASAEQLSNEQTTSEQQDATAEQENRGKDRQQNQQEKAEDEKIEKLKARDQEVRTHEQAHANVGGQHAGSPSYDFQRGPDGKNYAIGGEVKIDVSSVPNDPEATLNKMQQVKRAALAPSEPSAQDRKVAAEADSKIAQARNEMLQENSEQLQRSSNVIKAEEITEHDIKVKPVPFFEATQSLEIEQGFQRSYQDTMAQADEKITARALRIQKHYQVTSQPTQTSLSAYA